VPAYPLPQAIDPGRWTVYAGRGAVILLERRMWVPLSDDELAARVRAHEMAHVRFSPETLDVPPEHEASYLFAEDGRIGILALRLGIQTVPHVKIALGRRAPARLRARVILALLGGDAPATRRRNALMRELKPRHQQIVQLAAQAIQTDPENPDSARRAAEIIDRLPGNDDTPYERLSYYAGEWGSMQEEHPALSERVALPKRSTHRPDERGAALRYSHRYLLDRRMFASKRRERSASGTLLIDASASMGLTPSMVYDIARLSPALVAVYSGLNTGDPLLQHGYLRIVAHEGRIVVAGQTLSPRHSGGNVVDGPALRWLSAQTAPRIWFSDGNMTGVGDVPACYELRMQVEELIHESGIRHCRTIEAVRAVLERARRRALVREPQRPSWVQAQLRLDV
jgi:hypothetical protein